MVVCEPLGEGTVCPSNVQLVNDVGEFCLPLLPFLVLLNATVKRLIWSSTANHRQQLVAGAAAISGTNNAMRFV